MRKTASFALLLLGGCATARAPQPAAAEPAPVAVDIRPVQPKRAQPRGATLGIRGQCETNDPMPTAGRGVQPRPYPDLMPGMRMPIRSVPIPNACPVTVPPAEGVIFYAAPAGRKGIVPLRMKVQRRQ